MLKFYDGDKPLQNIRAGVGARERPPTVAYGSIGRKARPMPITNSSSPGFQALASNRLEANHVASFESVSRGPSFASNENYHTTLGMLFIGCAFAFVESR